VLLNLEAILLAAGCTFSDVVKTTILLTDIADFAVVNKAYGSCFKAEPPARATYAVAGLPLGALVEIEAVAALPIT
jgi:2-iminobutanoate/2-iminopropanoate deaminase